MNELEDRNYPFRIRYVPDDKVGYLEQYSPENKSIKGHYYRCSHSLYFRIKNLIFDYNLISNSNRYFKDGKHTVNTEESCRGEVEFGLINYLGIKPSLSYLGADKEIQDIAIKIKESANDNVGFNSFVGPDSTGGFLNLDLLLTKSFFQNMKELVLSKKLQDIILEVDAAHYPGIYENYHRDIRILASKHMVDNKDDMHKITDSHDSGGYEERWSKDFTLHLSYPNKTLFVADEESE